MSRAVSWDASSLRGSLPKAFGELRRIPQLAHRRREGRRIVGRETNPVLPLTLTKLVPVPISQLIIGRPARAASASATP